ncbi:hypothetical protein ACFPRL_34445 [Pseudoclavibacter helvolus]
MSRKANGLRGNQAPGTKPGSQSCLTRSRTEHATVLKRASSAPTRCR